MKLPHEIAPESVVNIAGIVISPAMAVFAVAADVVFGKHKAYLKTVKIKAEKLENCE